MDVLVGLTPSLQQRWRETTRDTKGSILGSLKQHQMDLNKKVNIPATKVGKTDKIKYINRQINKLSFINNSSDNPIYPM